MKGKLIALAIVISAGKESSDLNTNLEVDVYYALPWNCSYQAFKQLPS